MEENAKSFLGTGWSFPPRFSKQAEGLELSSFEDDIAESLYILLSTTPGERIMNPEYGCDLQSQVFQNINNTTKVIIQDMIATAISYFEPRVRLISVDIDNSQQNKGLIQIQLIYDILGVNSRKNMVYPYYLVEGTDI